MTAKTPKAAKLAAAQEFAAPTSQVIPLEKLRMAPENARFDEVADPESLKRLFGSMADPTVRQTTALNVYPEGDLFMVWEGGRRLQSLQDAAGGVGKPLKGPAHLAAGIRCDVDADRASARLRSAATFVREGLHPAKEFLVYKGLLDDGKSIDEIAAACAVAKPRVRQLLRLLGVCPEIIDAFKAGSLSLDAVEAFTVTEDRVRQWEAYLRLADAKRLDAWSIRSALRSGSVAAGSSLARFVGREAYAAAGGTFLVDLFSGDDDEDWADKALAEKLADDKVTQELDKLRADGWVNVAFARYEDYYYDSKLSWIRPNEKDGEAAYSDSVKANALAFLKQEYNGELKLRVYTRQAAAKVAADAPQKADPANFGFGHGGHFKLTHVATEAVRVGIANNHAAAYDAVVAHTAWAALRRDHSLHDSTASTLRPERLTSFIAVKGTDTFKDALKRWADSLPKGRVAFNVAVADLSAEEKAELLALCFAKTLDASEGRFDSRKPERWRDLGWMAKHSGTDVGAAWTPDEEFIKGGSKDAIIGALAEIGQTTPQPDKAKKGQLAKDLFKLAPERGWTPKLLATLADVEPEADDKKKGGRAAALAALAGTTPEGVEEVLQELEDETDGALDADET